TDGSAASVSDTFTLTVVNTNDAPTVAAAIADQSTNEDAAFNFVVPAATFADVDVGDTLTYTATLAGGGALPAWLSFNAATRTFSGTPVNGDVGPINVTVTATDGSAASVSDTFTLTVVNTNDAPTSITFGSNTPDVDEDDPGVIITTISGTDPDVGDTLTYTVDDNRFEIVTIGGGKVLKLKSGESLDFAPGATTVDVKITATDAAGASLDRTLTITINDINTAPGGVGGLSVWTPGSVEAGLRAAVLAAEAGIVDPDGDILTYRLVTAPTAGMLLIGTTQITVGMDLTQAQFEAMVFQSPEVAATYGAQFTVSDGVNAPVVLNVSLSVTAGINGNIGGTPNSDTLDGGAGDDSIFAQASSDLVFGGSGNDYVDGGSGSDTLNGGTGADSLIGGDGNDSMVGEAGNDVAFGGTGADMIIGGDGNDYLVGDSDDDTISGGADRDIIVGGTGQDSLSGNDGVDFLYGNAGNDTLYGNDGDDWLFTGDYAGGSLTGDADMAFGGAGNDVIAVGDRGGRFALADGGSGNDTIYGGAGANDVIRGGSGSDYLYGITGADTYRFGVGDLEAGDVDSVFAFNAGDKLSFDTSFAGQIAVIAGNNAGVPGVYLASTGSTWLAWLPYQTVATATSMLVFE
ncbi:MAG: putative Ig domain-containing protein, partial [Beijerinckiaceae bacterium]